MKEALVRIQDITKQFPGQASPALVDISATIVPGEFTGLVGPDGAGKTTLMRLMACLLTPTRGTIHIAGMNTLHSSAILHHEIGYMPQKFGLYEDLTVQENLDLYANLRGVEPQKRSETFDKLLHFTGLGSFTKRLSGQLSGGMKQKLGLACALMKEPKLLLLDEPSVGVDPISRRELWAMVEELVSHGMGVIWSTSYLDEAEQCQRVLLLNEGKLLFDGNPPDLANEVKGRTFFIKGVRDNKREILTVALDTEGIIDGVIQGDYVRIVTANAESRLDLPFLKTDDKIVIEPIGSRFEDGFVNRLGGGPKGTSPLAQKMDSIKLAHESVIECKGLTKRFGDFVATDQVDFSIKQGEIFGFLGPNGAGKSTTFKMLCGLLKPTAGEAYVTKINLRTSSSQARARIGYMAQKFSLYGNLSVAQNLRFFSGIYGLKGDRQRLAIEEMIETFELGPLLKQNADQLPLGFKQRLALACAVMHRPAVLFLDEPTSGVDPITRREFWSHINGLVQKGVTIMVTTHFMDEAEYCDRIALIYRGKKIADGPPDDLKRSVKSINLPNPTMEDAFIELIKQHDQIQGSS